MSFLWIFSAANTSVVEDDDLKMKIEKQNSEFHKLKDEIEEIDPETRKSILESNNQAIPGNPTDVRYLLFSLKHITTYFILLLCNRSSIILLMSFTSERLSHVKSVRMGISFSTEILHIVARGLHTDLVAMKKSLRQIDVLFKLKTLIEINIRFWIMILL